VLPYRTDQNKGQDRHHRTGQLLLRDEVKQETEGPVVNVYNMVMSLDYYTVVLMFMFSII